MIYNRIIQVVIVVMASVIFFAFASQSSASRLINFQGKLTDQQCNTLEGTYNIIFTIYDSATATSPLWAEDHTNVSARNGIVNVLLGSIQSFDEPVKVTFDQERYLGITIDCDHDPNTKDEEMTPRQRMLPAIYAYEACNADKLGGKDSAEYTTPEKDAGRPGVVENLYEGNIRLIDKYMKAEGGTIIGDINIIGNVGIGTTSPSARLEVMGGSVRAPSFLSYVDSMGPRHGLTMENPSGMTGIWSGGFHADSIAFYTGSTMASPYDCKMRIQGNGNIAIGKYDADFKLHVNGSFAASSKYFDIPDPRYNDESKRLIHGSLEGPENAVYYRGENILAEGAVIVELPNYFESLTSKEGRTVQLTCKNGWSPLYVDGNVLEGKFIVKTTKYGNKEQEFFWEVKAVRADIDSLQTEVKREK